MSIPGNFSEKVTSRYSKLSSALKKSLFDSVFVDGLNIREASIRLKINYSTAKVLIQVLRKNYPEKTKEIYSIPRTRRNLSRKHNFNKKQCKYKQNSQKQNTSASQTNQDKKKTKIEIISTVGWNFLDDGMPVLCEGADVYS